MAGQPTRSMAGLATLLLLSFLIPTQAAIVGWGGRDVTFTPPTLNGPINTIIQLKVGANAGKYLIGGSFTDAGGNAAIDYVARLNADGTIDTTFTPPTFSNGNAGCVQADTTNAPLIQVRTLLETQTTSGTNTAGKIYIGGNFTAAGGTAKMDYLIRVNANGGNPNTGFYPTSDGLSTGTATYTNCVHTIFTGEGAGAAKTLLVGSMVNGRLTKRVFDTVVPIAFASPPTFNAAVTSGFFCDTTVGCSANRYVLGGRFSTVNSDAKLSRLVRLNTNGSVDTTGYPTTTGTSAGTILLDNRVESIAPYPSTAATGVVVGGLFTGRIALVNLSNFAPDGTFTAPTSANDGFVYSVAVDDDNAKLLYAGAFTDLGTYPACDYVCFSDDSGEVVDTDGRSYFTAPPPGAAVNVVTVNTHADSNQGKYMIGGAFTNLGGNANTDYIGRLNQADPASVTLNSSGGNNPGGADGIRTVYSNGQWQVYREGSGQLFEPTNNPPIDLTYNQIALSLTAPGGGGYMIGPSSLYFGGQNIVFAGGYLYRPWGTVTATGGSTGSGTAASDLTVEVDGRTYVVHLNLSYTYPDNYVRQTFTVDIPAGNTYNVKLYNL